MSILAKKILVQSMTLSRVVLSILFACYIGMFPHEPVVTTALFAAICATDFFDGRLARRFAVTSKSGAVLDTVADLLFVLEAYAVLMAQGALPVWMPVVALGKFIEFWLTSQIAKAGRGGGVVFFFDRLGRMVAVGFYALPLLVYLARALLPEAAFGASVLCCCLLLTIGAAVSSAHRVKSCLAQGT